jgi:hypothetical protein
MRLPAYRNGYHIDATNHQAKYNQPTAGWGVTVYKHLMYAVHRYTVVIIPTSIFQDEAAESPVDPNDRGRQPNSVALKVE